MQLQTAIGTFAFLFDIFVDYFTDGSCFHKKALNLVRKNAMLSITNNELRMIC